MKKPVKARARSSVASDPSKEVEARLQAIIDNIVDGIITIDEFGTVESFNPAAEKIFGCQADDVIGNNVKTLMPQPYTGEHDGYLRNYMRTGDAKIIGIGREVSGRRKDGTLFPVDLAVTEMTVGKVRKFVGIIRDITDRKQSENLITQQSQALMDMSTPALKIWDNVLLLPLIGVIDTNRVCAADHRRSARGRGGERGTGGHHRCDRRANHRYHGRPALAEDHQLGGHVGGQGDRDRHQPRDRANSGQAAGRFRQHPYLRHASDGRGGGLRFRWQAGCCRVGSSMKIPVLKLKNVLLTSIQVEMTDVDALEFQDDVLHKIKQTEAQGIVIDITALEVVDSYLARILNDTANMARLLGAESGSAACSQRYP